MKIEKKLWITLFVFGLFAIGFSGWIFSQSTAREKLLWDNTIRFETKKLTDGEIKSENIALPEDFDDPRSILFKTTHTIAEVWLVKVLRLELFQYMTTIMEMKSALYTEHGAIAF